MKIGSGEFKEEDYVLGNTDFEINKKINRYLNTENKDFSISPTKLSISVDKDDDSYRIDLKDIADQVVIYDKYRTNESLYERDDIGLKNLWTCTEIHNKDTYYGFAEDNFYYDISTQIYSYLLDEYKYKDNYMKIYDEAKKMAKEEVEKYRKIAQENPEKFYLLFLVPSVDHSFNREPSEYKCYNLISLDCEKTLDVFENKSTTKQELMDNLIPAYRYPNLGMYPSVKYLYYGESEYWHGFVASKENIIKEETSKIYLASNLKEVKSINEIFKENVDYMSIIKNKLMSRGATEAEATEMMNKAKYTLDKYGINATVDNDRKDFYIGYDELDRNLLASLDTYIIPESNIRNIEKSEIENLSLEDLNRAYNEIFARHGHDFQNKELREYFNGCFWYTKVEGKSVTMEELNEFERNNIKLIKNLIEEKKVK